MKHFAKPGEWISPLTAEMVASSRKTIGWVQIVGDDLWWDELRPDDEGRTVVVSRVHGDLFPAPWSASSKVHEYGGLSWLGFTKESKQMLAFVNSFDQRIYVKKLQREPLAITPASSANESYRYIEMIAVDDEIWCIRETHRGRRVSRDLVAVSDFGVRTLESSSHFIAHPRVSPDGTKITWVAWDHPQMPWDGTVLKVADIDHGAMKNIRTLVGSSGISSLSPEWGGTDIIYFTSDKSGWWNLWKSDLAGNQSQIINEETEWDQPHWFMGYRPILPLPNGKLLCLHGPVESRKLTLVDPVLKSFRDLESELNSFKSTFTVDGERAYAVGSGTSIVQQLVEFDLETLKVREVIREIHAPVDSSFLTTPYAITVDGKRGRTVHAIVHPARNPNFEQSELTPLLVMVHGGPTDNASASVNLAFNYFTSRGIPIVDVNHGGSSGYGREYRNSLRGKWGIIDREDVISVVEDLIRRGIADKSKILISGGSAGGFTVLNALVNSHSFAAGSSYYGISDLTSFMTETHDFESRYLDSLIGFYPEYIEEYRERSPLTHADRLSTPLIIFQGLEDHVVPPSQSLEFLNVCQERGIQHEYLSFPNEGHGFFKSSSIVRSIEAELDFFARVLGFRPTHKGNGRLFKSHSSSL
jgi:dipeptidyl aminopeptidase/acylaminoacyl peptidase